MTCSRNREDSRMEGGRKVDEASKVMAGDGGWCRGSFYCEKDRRPWRVLSREVIGLTHAVPRPP